jgi:ATP synthase protein I
MSSRKENDDPWLAYLSRTADRGPRLVLPSARAVRLAGMKTGPLSRGHRGSGQLDQPEADRREQPVQPDQQQSQPSPAARESDGWQILSYMLGGMLLYGGAGWLVSRWTGIAILFPVGMILGVVLSVAMIIFRFTRN